MRSNMLLQIVLYVVEEITTCFRVLHALATISPTLPVIPPDLN